MPTKRVMIVGLGNLGGHVLDLLIRRPHAPHVIVAGRDQTYIHQKTNLSTLVATQLGYSPRVETVVMDVHDIDRTAETIAATKPDIIFSTVSLQAWWVINELPKAVFEELDEAQIGPWLPMQLTLIYKLMQAVKRSGVPAKVVNAALPDATHTILDKIGLAPTIGVGNAANIIPGLRHTVATKLSVPVEAVQVYLVTEAYVSHRVPRYGNTNGAPFYLAATVDGQDVTSQLDMDSIFDLLPTKFRRIGGVIGSVLTAASSITVLDGLLYNSHHLTHAPGPNALVGGYPVRMSEEGGEVVLPPGLTMERAREINEECLKYDGIEAIEDDGTVVYTEREMAIMKRMMGYERRRMHVTETEDCAIELSAKYAEFRKKYSAT